MTTKLTPFFALIVFIFGYSETALAQHSKKEAFRNRIKEIIQQSKADVGVAIVGLASKDNMTFNGNKRFPMQSVYKFHLALAVLDQVDKGKFFLNQIIHINKDRLDTATWSPMVADYPNQDIAITLSELLRYTVAKSDNNACDVLFELVGGTQKVHAYIQRIGIQGVEIAATEAEMKKDWQVQFTNWSTPLSAVQLLEKYYHENILTKNSRDFLWELMVASVKPDRIKGLLPTQAVVAHKPGTSGRTKQGIQAAFNDIGIVTLPNGQHFAVAVFISDARERDEANAKTIANISKTAWDYFTEMPKVDQPNK